MTPDSRRSIARGGAAAFAVVIAMAAGVATADYVRARVRQPADAARVAQLQEQARSDSSAARMLLAEQDRITRARLARNRRTDLLAIVLIVASVGFIGCAKWRIAEGPRRPPAPPNMVRVRTRPPAPRLEAATTAAVAPAVSVTPAIDISFVDHIVRQEGTSREAAIPILQAIQTHYRYLPDEALRRVCELTEITPSQIGGTSSFYARFRRSPVGQHVVRVCHGTACHVSGARQITDELRRHLQLADGADTDPQGLFTIDEVACLGCCSLAPVLMVDEHTAGRLTPDEAVAALAVATRAKAV